MNNELVRKVGSTGQDNLIAKLFPPAETFGVKVAANQGVLKRGTVLKLDEGEETYSILDKDGEANCVLADDIDTGEGDSVTGVAYRLGHFNRRALIVADGHELTVKNEEELRKGGILLTDMMD